MERFRRISPDEFEGVFAIMQASFPKDERRSFSGQRALLDREDYSIYALFSSEDKVMAFAAVYELCGVLFLEHLAVDSAFRGGGIGSEILNELKALSVSPVCLEVEPPDTDISRRRVEFYRRNGFYFNAYPYRQPSLGEGREPIKLFIMSSGGELAPEEFEKIRNLIYSDVYKV